MDINNVGDNMIYKAKGRTVCKGGKRFAEPLIPDQSATKGDGKR